MTKSQAEAVIEFWFDESTPEQWFKKDDAFDEEIRKRFWKFVSQARRGRLDHWADYPYGALALILLLDQFSRNLFRGDARAFSCDDHAKRIAIRSIDMGFDERVKENERCFFYFPFEHSELLDDQKKSVELFTALGNENYLSYAIAHKEVIEQFGRFPHRNAVLGRNSTVEEEKWLAAGGGF